MVITTPNLAQDLVRIHKVITRGLEVSLSKGTEYLQAGFPQPQVLLGYSSYTHCLASVFGSHHQGEDLIFFPEFRKLIPSVPYGRLSNEHRAIEMRLVLISQAITDLSGNNQQNGLRMIVDTLGKISRIWVPHIQMEERYFSGETLNAVMDLEQQRRISEAASKYSQEHSGPPFWVVPFVLYNLGDEDRASMAATFPPEIMDELISNVWKDQWAPMKPLLLD